MPLEESPRVDPETGAGSVITRDGFAQGDGATFGQIPFDSFGYVCCDAASCTDDRGQIIRSGELGLQSCRGGLVRPCTCVDGDLIRCSADCI